MCFVVGEAPRGHLVGVVDATGDDRVVRVAVDVFDDDFLSNPGRVDDAKVRSRPWVADAYPAARLFVILAVTIPRKLDLHASVRVGVDFLTGRADDDGDLRALCLWFMGEPLRAIGLG